jgi:16S rRNA (guanine1207-N2)-methyltransferase
VTDHYFSAQPTSPHTRASVTVTVWGNRLQLQSAGGVFSAGRLDPGTAVLLRSLEPPMTPGRYLDLGCGYGVIACALAAANPAAEVWAVDVNARALELCRVNAAAVGVAHRLVPVRPEEVPADLEFDEIWSNPPIRIGKAALHELLHGWLSRLRPTGRALLVVSKNLGADSLQRWLVDQGLACERRASAKGFRVLEVTRQVAKEL